MTPHSCNTSQWGIEKLVASLYPTLAERTPIPILYFPICFVLAILPFLMTNIRLGIILTALPLLLLCVRLPFYTFGDASSDYYNSGPFLALLLWYIDFVICTPRQGSNDAPAFLGPPGSSDKSTAQTWTTLHITSQRLRWAARLMLPAHRGIGWNWQVKGVPDDPYAELSRRDFVARHVFWAVFYYVQSAIMLVVLGWSSALRLQYSRAPANIVSQILINAVVGWSGAIWVWDRLNCAYSVAAALSVSFRVFDTWEWPPLMGSLIDAWSVRQMWSLVYHQVFRRMLSQPAVRITRLLSLRKGGWLSQYTQLYLVFGLSCVFHQFQMFNVTRRDMGEFVFFMSQPLAITAEDTVQGCWRRIWGPAQPGHRSNTIVVGYLWTFVWFSLSLHWYIDGLLRANVISDWLLGDMPLMAGRS